MKSGDDPQERIGKPVFAKKTRGGSVQIGTIEQVLLNEWVDGAVIRLNADTIGYNSDDELPPVSFPAREIGWSEQCPVQTNGATSAPSRGVVRSHQNAVRINYGPDNIRTLNHLIQVSTSALSDGAITRPGDSGALLFDGQMRAIGMVIAGSDDFTYAVPITRLESWFTLKMQAQ